MNESEARLWRRIASFEFDDPASAFTFTQRLARENGWSVGYADAVLEEYRRFLFLAMTAGHEVTPSEEVDQAWHLHLTYTRSYWDDLCRDVLGCPLHHGPTKGGAADASRFREQYEQTLAGYRSAFNEEPPASIWPPADERFAHPGRYVLVDRRRSWVVAKPWAPVRRLQRSPVARQAFALCPPLLLAVSNPFNLNGPEFLSLYATLAVGTLVAAVVLRRLLRAGEYANSEPLTAYQAACLAGGPDAATRSATASLLRRGAIKVAPASAAAPRDMRFTVDAGTPPDAEEIEQRIVAACGVSNGARFGELLSYGKPSAEKIQHRLEAWGLVVPSDGLHICRWAPTLLMMGLMAFGAIKLYVGLQRDKPVGFLVGLLIVTFLVMIWFVSKPHRTGAGDQMLRALRRERRDLRKRSQLKQAPDDIAATAWAVALFGVGPCAYGDLALLPDACRYPNGPSASGGDSGGCGGSGDGGGGCGGGGCGGGCGGCGG